MSSRGLTGWATTTAASKLATAETMRAYHGVCRDQKLSISVTGRRMVQWVGYSLSVIWPVMSPLVTCAEMYVHV